MSIAGGPTDQADLRNVLISRQGYKTQGDIYVNLFELLQNPEKSNIPEIKNGDIIFIPLMSTASYVRVMGAVRSPGPYYPNRGENIADMINLAGGSLPDGNLNRIIFIKFLNGRYEVENINVKTLLNKGLVDQIPVVGPGDIIIVSDKRWWENGTWWVQALRDVALILSSFVILSRL
jgi:protein involved in polysaccharide export with SLBB domain